MRRPVEDVFSRPLQPYMRECLSRRTPNRERCGKEPVGLVSRMDGSNVVFLGEVSWPCREHAEDIIERRLS